MREFISPLAGELARASAGLDASNANVDAVLQQVRRQKPARKQSNALSGGQSPSFRGTKALFARVDAANASVDRGLSNPFLVPSKARKLLRSSKRPK
jgi:hypothetical protein